jgi:hypothetical protein
MGSVASSSWAQEPAHAQGVLNWQVAEDFWSIRRNVGPDTHEYIRPSEYLFLPDSNIQWTYRNPSTSVQVAGVKRLGANLQLDIKFRANQQVGAKLDQFGLSYEISSMWGWRAGIVDYRTTWCQTYEPDSPWIYIPTLSCENHNFLDTAGGAPGVQTYINLEVSDQYRVQALLGVYDPLKFNYATQEFGLYQPSQEYAVLRNQKWGASLNVLDDYTGTEYRLSWIRARQLAWSPESSLLFYTHQRTDMLYAAMQQTLAERWNVVGSHTWRQFKNYCVDTSQASCEGAVALVGGMTTLEAVYLWDARNSVGLAYSKYQVLATWADTGSEFAHEAHRALAVSWRKNWTHHWFSVVQWQRSDQVLGYYNTVDFPSMGVILGVRVGYRFDQ